MIGDFNVSKYNSDRDHLLDLLYGNIALLRKILIYLWMKIYIIHHFEFDCVLGHQHEQEESYNFRRADFYLMYMLLNVDWSPFIDFDSTFNFLKI